jgi:hypothetical protein
MKRQPHGTSERKRRSRPTPRWLMKKTDLDEVARNRVMLVLSVLSGETPVSTAIEQSGISRGLYYQLETKALNAMLLALAPGADGDASPDATGLHHRIKDLEDKVTRAEQAQRRAERLLFVHRKLSSGAVKTQRGRPARSAPSTTSSTRTGRSDWRSSMTTTTTKPKSSRASMPSTSTTATKPVAAPASTPTPAGTTAVP